MDHTVRCKSITSDQRLIRYAGEEFVVLVIGCNVDAPTLAERLRQRVTQSPLIA